MLTATSNHPDQKWLHKCIRTQISYFYVSKKPLRQWLIIRFEEEKEDFDDPGRNADLYIFDQMVI